MLFVSVSNPNELPFLPPHVDAVEWRLDLFPQPRITQLPPFPVVLTVRGSQQEALIEELLALEPPYFDLEQYLSPSFLRRVLTSYPKTRFILSYHNFQEVPDLEALCSQMSQYPAYTYKIAVTPRSTSEALKALLFVKKHPSVSVICMGELSSFARVLGRVVGNRVNYACLGEPVAPGQLSLGELVSIYRYPRLNCETALYGLIGDPVDQSRGHIYHNGVFEARGLNAVYLKMRVQEEELAEFLPLARELGFRGLSVTMPLKEKIIPSHPVNTLLFQGAQLLWTNTDGVGALDAVERRGSVRGKRLLILGAGGAAKAIALEATRRGAEVWIVNRTEEKGRALAAAVGGFYGVPPIYATIISCTSELLPVELRQGVLAMDVVYVPRETPFLQKARLAGAEVIYGEEMFLNQAAAQAHFWGMDI